MSANESRRNASRKVSPFFTSGRIPQKVQSDNHFVAAFSISRKLVSWVTGMTTQEQLQNPQKIGKLKAEPSDQARSRPPQPAAQKSPFPRIGEQISAVDIEVPAVQLERVVVDALAYPRERQQVVQGNQDRGLLAGTAPGVRAVSAAVRAAPVRSARLAMLTQAPMNS